MDAPRFFAPDATNVGAIVELPADEATHLTRVLRLAAGDPVRVFDGRGHEWTAVIESSSKQRVRVKLERTMAPVAEAGIAVTLALAVLKGDKMDDCVRDAVMLGVHAIQPLVTSRTEVSAASIEKSGRLARWQRIAVSSAKQCGRAVVPVVQPLTTMAPAVQQDDLAIVLVEPGAHATARSLRELPRADRATVLIGPEGGWTADELGLAAASGAMLVTLAAPTLRADAMPVVALTALRVHWGDF